MDALPLDTSRVSLQVTTRLALTGMDAVTFDTTDARIVRPYSGYTSELRYMSRFDTTDARPSVPTTVTCLA